MSRLHGCFDWLPCVCALTCISLVFPAELAVALVQLSTAASINCDPHNSNNATPGMTLVHHTFHGPGCTT